MGQPPTSRGATRSWERGVRQREPDPPSAQNQKKEPEAEGKRGCRAAPTAHPSTMGQSPQPRPTAPGHGGAPVAFFHAKMTAEARGPRAVPPWRGSAATRRPFHRRETEAAAVMRSESRAGLGRAALPDSQPGPRPAAGMGGSRCPRPAPGRTPATPRGSTRDDTASSGDAAGLEQRRGCGGDPGAAGRCRGLGLRAPQRNSPGPQRGGAERSGGAPVVPRAAAPSGDRTAAGTAGAGRIAGGSWAKRGAAPSRSQAQLPGSPRSGPPERCRCRRGAARYVRV